MRSHFHFMVETVSDKPGQRAFWFGRRNDALRPVKVDAASKTEAWERLEKMEKRK